MDFHCDALRWILIMDCDKPQLKYLVGRRQYGQMKSRDGKSQRREEKRRRKKIKKRKSPKKEDPGARKGRKVAKHYVVNDLWLRRAEK